MRLLIEPLQFFRRFWEFGGGVEGVEDLGEEVGGGRGIDADALAIQHDLGVGEIGEPFVGEDEGEGGFADAAHSLDAADRSGGEFSSGAEFLEIGGAADEILGAGGELVEAGPGGQVGLCGGEIGGYLGVVRVDRSECGANAFEQIGGVSNRRVRRSAWLMRQGRAGRTPVR